MTERHVGAPTTQGPGQMTAVMRAVTRTHAPRALRIAVVFGGVVTDERILAKRVPVSIGPTERCTFVVASRALPPGFKLFEVDGSAYKLNLLAGMTARVATRAGLRNLGAGGRGGELVLGDESRGKVVVGETTFLFQFVEPPAARNKPQLPLSVQNGLASDIDWGTTIVAAMSFLLHFGVVAALYGDWLNPVVDDEVRVAQLLESVKPPVTLPAIEKTETATVATAGPSASAAPSATPAGGKSTGTGGNGNKGTRGSNKGMDDARAHELSEQLKAFDTEMLISMNQHGSHTEGVLRESGDIPLGNLNDAAKSAAGANRGAVAGLNMTGNGGGVVRPGSGGGNGLKDIGNRVGTAPTSAGSAVTAPRPTGNARVDGPIATGGTVGNAGTVVAGMAPRFRKCYNDGIARDDPNMRGSMKLSARVGPNGDVVGVTTTGGGGLSGGVISCVTARVAGAHFDPPSGGGAIVVIPVTFTQ